MLNAVGDSPASAPLPVKPYSAALREFTKRSWAWPAWISFRSARGKPSAENAGLSEPLTCSAMLTCGLRRASPAYRRCKGLSLLAMDWAENPPQQSMPMISSSAAGAR
ncbi:hypothetical protein D3C86_1648990 [compost metagenome]